MQSPLRTLGIIGGMSWESTLTYYRLLNEETARRYGGLHSAPCILWSVDFAPIAEAMHADSWDKVREALTAAARGLASAGAELLLLATNTMHLFAREVEEASGLPLCHIARASGDAAREKGITSVGLIGTRFTMEKPFYRELLAREYGMHVLVPESSDERARLNEIIFDELCRGRVEHRSSAWIGKMIEGLARRGAGAVLLGCTELGLAVEATQCSIPLYDTVELHVRAALADAARG